MMNRLQKKCLIATVGTHFLLIVIVLVGPGFFTSHPKPDNTQLLEAIPANVVDSLYNSGEPNPTPPPPQSTPVTPPVAQPDPPKAEVKPPTPKPEPVKQPDPKPEPEKAPEPEKTVNDAPALEPKPVKPVKPKLNLTVVTHKVAKPTPDDDDKAQAEAAAKAAKAKADARRKAFSNALTNIKTHATTSTEVKLPGPGSVSYASYASVVKSIYENAWIEPDDASSDDANVKVSVTIARDGRVLESHITDPSGDAKLDASIRRALDRVTFVREFPEGATESQRTFIINFNLKAKRLLG